MAIGNGLPFPYSEAAHPTVGYHFAHIAARDERDRLARITRHCGEAYRRLSHANR